MGYVDIHSHCTWGIDDGIATQKEYEECLNQAIADGISTIVATPHVIPGSLTDLEAIIQRMNEAEMMAKQKEIQYYKGSELLLNYDYMEMIANKKIITLAGSKYVLVEFNAMQSLGKTAEVEDRLYELIIADYIPIIAHAERYFKHELDIERIKLWIHMGCKIQVNRTSLLGLHGKVNEMNAIKLLKEGLVHVIATDTHRIKGNRITKMSDVYEFINKKFDQDTANLLLIENPSHIIQNEQLEDMKIKQKKHLFWRRG